MRLQRRKIYRADVKLRRGENSAGTSLRRTFDRAADAQVRQIAKHVLLIRAQSLIKCGIVQARFAIWIAEISELAKMLQDVYKRQAMY